MKSIRLWEAVVGFVFVQRLYTTLRAGEGDFVCVLAEGEVCVQSVRAVCLMSSTETKNGGDVPSLIYPDSQQVERTGVYPLYSVWASSASLPRPMHLGRAMVRLRENLASMKLITLGRWSVTRRAGCDRMHCKVVLMQVIFVRRIRPQFGAPLSCSLKLLEEFLIMGSYAVQRQVYSERHLQISTSKTSVRLKCVRTSFLCRWDGGGFSVQAFRMKTRQISKAPVLFISGLFPHVAGASHRDPHRACRQQLCARSKIR